MRVLVVCERSGVVRRAFRALGHKAFSCDLEPADDCQEHHYQVDALRAAYMMRWDLLIGHPECTYLANSGAKHLYADMRAENGPAEMQPNPKQSWLVPYDDLSEADREADRQIGEAIARWTLIHDAAAIATAARQGGDVKQAPGEAPQSGGEAASPNPSEHPTTGDIV